MSMTHRMMMLAIQLGVIVIAARLGNRLFTRLRLPGVVGELMTGVLIGPYVLGGLPLPGFPHGLFYVSKAIAVGAIPVSPELYGICAIASIVLLFLVGLETDIGLLMRYSIAGSLVGIGGVAATFFVGNWMAVLFSPMLFGEQLGFFDAPCLFLGIISTATSVGITARVLAEKRKLDSPEGVTILAGAVIDDVLGMILLAVGMGIITASSESGRIDWGHIGIIAFKAIAVWLAATVLGLLASRRISTMLKTFRDPSVIATMSLGLALILAGLFEEAGLAMIIGGYVMGLSLSHSDLSHVIRERLHPVYVFLVPVFFTVMGMLVDVRVLLSTEVLLFGVLYTLAISAAKMAGCGVPALFANFNPRGALRIGVGMLPRGEVTLIIAGIGLAAGTLNPTLFGVVVFMTLCSALIAPPSVVAMFSSNASGLRHALPDTGGDPLVFPFPSFEAAEMLVTRLLAAFEEEGFFVHTIDREERLYQLRKESTVISFQHRGCEIVFESATSQTAFINTAMLEVVAGLEWTLKQLREPLDKQGISRGIQEQATEITGSAWLREFLSEDQMSVCLAADTKEAAIDELLDLLVRKGAVHDVAEARQAILDRESSMSTGMQFGIAIPHGRSDCVDRIVCAIGIKPDGIDFDSIDGRLCRIVVLTLSPSSSPAPHMQFMSMMSQVLGEQGRASLLGCDSTAEMLAVLTGPCSVSGKRSGVMKIVGLGREQASGLGQFVRRDLLLPSLQARTKEEVIDELLDAIAATGCLRSRDAAREAIMAREEQMSTGMEHGVAIPHARTDEVDELVCAVGTTPKGLEFGSLDGEPSRIFILTLTPRRADAPHVQFMATVCRFLDDRGRELCLGAQTRDELYDVLVGT